MKLRTWLREYWLAAVIIGAGIPIFWAVLWFTIGPPFDARHEGAASGTWPGWHVDVPDG